MDIEYFENRILEFDVQISKLISDNLVGAGRCARPRSHHSRTILSNDKIIKYFKYLNIVWEWNKKINLVSAKDKFELFEEHLLDSLALAITLQQFTENDSEEILDVGSGNGFPGIVLGILLKNPIHLCETREKRAIFLKEARRVLGLENVQVHCCRMEELENKNFSKLRFVTARALGMQEVFRQEAKRLFAGQVIGQGQIIEMAGPGYEKPNKGDFEIVSEFNYTIGKDNKQRSLKFLQCFT